jgi:predicted TPR repeat methyltransferase
LVQSVSVAVRHYDAALEELANGRPAAAVAALKQALALDPELVPAHHALGMALEELGRLDEAETAYRDALRVDPACVAALNSLGDLLQRRGRLEEARQCFQGALGINPTRLLYTRLGAVLWKLGDSAGALQAFEHSVAGGASSAEAYYNLGSAQLELGRFDEAVHSAREALRLRPGFSEAQILCAAALAATGAVDAGAELLQKPGGYLLLAIRLMNSRLFEPARVCLEKALRENPTEVMARHLLLALSGENPERPVEGYVRQLFDASAATFDHELVVKLGYGIPRQMIEALRAVAVAPGSRWDVLDLGCGTGLVGAEIAPYSASLVGVDLAPNMIELARERRIYTELRCADLMTVLADEAARPGFYDVITAADVFIYVGKIDAVVAAIRQVLRPGGLFAFSAEAAEPTTEGYRLGVMGRYAHSTDYLRHLAGENGFEIEMLRATRIRFEHRRPVPGWLTLWRVPQGSSAAG